MKKKASFSYDIVKMIAFAYGMAFLIIFVAGSILFYLNDPDTKSYLIKIAILFGVFLILYICSVIILQNNLVKRFAPLDKLARGLIDDEIFIYGESKDLESFALQLKNDMEKMQILSKELEETKEDLDDYYQESESIAIDTAKDLEKSINHNNSVLKRSKRIRDNLSNANEAFDVIIPIEAKLKSEKESIYDDSLKLKKYLRDALEYNKDVNEDIKAVKDAYDILMDMLNDSIAQLDNLYNDIMNVQSISTKMNIYAVNTSLEAAKSGFYNLNIINAIDEIKEMTKKVMECNDEIALFLIKSKNSINIAKEQAFICNEDTDSYSKSISISSDKLDNLGSVLDGTMTLVDEVVNNITKVTTKVYDIRNYNDNISNDSSYIWDSSIKDNERNSKLLEKYKQEKSNVI